MKVTKESLQFLRHYVSISETSTVLGDKLKIEVMGGVARFTQKSKDVTLIKSVNCDTAETFSLLVQTKMFWDFLNTISKDEELIITDKGISLGADKSYSFEDYNLDFPNIDNLVKDIETAKSDDTLDRFDFKDFDKLAVVNKYMGKDSLECVGLMKDKILATDRVAIAYTDGQLKLNADYFISKNAVSLILGQKGKEESVRITLDKKYYFIEVDGVLCIFDWKTFSVPPLFDSGIYDRFNQTDKVTVAKSDLMSALTRMSFFVSSNPSNRIFITIEKDTILIENRDFNKSFEKIPLIEGNVDLVGAQVILNCKTLISFISNFEEDSVNLFINSDPAIRLTARFEDSTGVLKFVHSRLKEE